MLSLDFSIDLHVHPTYKPLGKSFQRNQFEQDADPEVDSSLWYYNPPSPVDKLLNYLITVTKFSQTNLTASAYGRVWVIVVSLGTIEKWFFKNRLGTGMPGNMLDNFASGFGMPRISAIEKLNDYFTDLQKEIEFIKKMNDVEVEIDDQCYKYKLVRNFSELECIMKDNAVSIEDANTRHGKTRMPITIALIPSIEGMHVLNCGLDNPCDPAEVKANAKALKNFEHRPWFVTFSHHFYNELSGHAKSLQGFVAKACDQSVGLGESFTALGKDVLDILLDNTDGKRILIDIKHLSPQARIEYLAIRKQRDPDYKEVPIIISHGVCNGLPYFGATQSMYPELGDSFHNGEINFYDEEIIELVKSNGIMGLQLDERRIANQETLRRTKNSIFRNKIMHYRSELLWRQIQYIAELLDKHDLPSWRHIAIGSDYDGIVDPLNSFWTTEHYDDLKGYLERHAHNYVSHHLHRLINPQNKLITAEQIVQNIFQNNAWDFFRKWF